MPFFNLRTYAQKISTQQDKVFFIQIGAMDGKKFDPIHEYINSYKWHGLLVEPLPDLFMELQKTYAGYDGLLFENSAITEKEGIRAINRITREAVENSQVPIWGMGVSSFYTDRNALAWESVEPFRIQQNVSCITLPQLLTKHHIKSCDVLQIDTEGYDYHILRQLDFNHYRPKIINMEFVNLPKAEQTACRKLLDQHHYIYIKGGYDLLAIAEEWVSS